MTLIPLMGYDTHITQEGMDLKELEITPGTHPLLIQLSHCYQTHSNAPGCQELLERQYPTDYQMPVVTGWLTFKSLVKQAGYDLEDELKKAEAAMNRAMEDDTND